MGFSMARASWALHHSGMYKPFQNVPRIMSWISHILSLSSSLGNSSLEAAVNWIIDHENDSQFEKMPLVCIIHLYIFLS